MADEKLSDLPSVTPATGDLLYLVDISDTTDSAGGSSKKTTVADVLALVPPPPPSTAAWGSITGTLSSQTDLQTALDARQPLDADLTSWAGVTRASGFDTFAATPSSANLAALLSDETGSGAAVFGTGPTLAGPVTLTTSGSTVGLSVDATTPTAAPLRVRIGGVVYAQVDASGYVYAISGFYGAGSSSQYAYQLSSVGLGMSATLSILWAPGGPYNNAGDVFNVADTGVKRATAKVVGVTDGSTGGGTIRSVPLAPAQITSNQNNYAPGVAHTYRLSTDASRDITGLSISQVSGQWGRIFNVGSFNIVLKHQDANSTAANRFLSVTGADITLAPDEGAGYEYDSATSRFRVWKL